MSNTRVLLVEDELLVAQLMEELTLELGAASVHMEPSAKAALDYLGRQRPDIAMLDVNLGGETSYAVASRLDELAVPFLFLTGYGPAGVQGIWRNHTIVQKPCSLEALAASVMRARSG